MWYNYNALGFPSQLMALIIPLIIFDLILRGMALWRSARRGENVWFIFLLVINSVGILPLIYLLTHNSKKR